MQSLRPEQLGLALQVDMAVTAFLAPGPVIDFLQRAAGLRDPSDFAHATPVQLRKANKAIIGIKVGNMQHTSISLVPAMSPPVGGSIASPWHHPGGTPSVPKINHHQMQSVQGGPLLSRKCLYF